MQKSAMCIHILYLAPCLGYNVTVHSIYTMDIGGCHEKVYIPFRACGGCQNYYRKRICDILGRSAFIDGDWCLDIYPFVGNKETKSMAIDNIIHMIRNYYSCSECDSIVLSWAMSENTVNKIISGISDLDLQIYSFTLTCDEESLISRWKKDTITEWRNDEELSNSLKSIENYNSRTGTYLIDTSSLSINMSVGKIIEMLL